MRHIDRYNWDSFCQQYDKTEDEMKSFLFKGELSKQEFETLVDCSCPDLTDGVYFIDYGKLFASCPRLIEYCKWTRLDELSWTDLLSQKPEFADKCNKWDEFDGDAWSWLLAEQPQFADKCDWNKLTGVDWAALLYSQPQFADKCDKWNEFNPINWFRLLDNQPQFADKCNKWSRFGFDSLKFLLLRHPQFFDKYPSEIWRHFSAVDYKRLLVKNNKIAEKLDGKNWSQLLCKYPQFEEICAWDKLYASNWASLLRRCPDFAEKCDKYDDFSATDWKNLLSEQPQFADKCAWHKINRNTILVDLLMKQPQLIVHCNTSVITGKGKAKLLAKYPDLAKYFPEAVKKVDDNQPKLF